MPHKNSHILLSCRLDSLVLGQYYARREIGDALDLLPLLGGEPPEFLFRDSLDGLHLPGYMPALEHLLTRTQHEVCVGLCVNTGDATGGSREFRRLCQRSRRLHDVLVSTFRPSLLILETEKRRLDLDFRDMETIAGETAPDGTRIFYSGPRYVPHGSAVSRVRPGISVFGDVPLRIESSLSDQFIAPSR